VSVHILRLGTPRGPREGPRIGAVRRPPRGVPKAEFASGDWYDVWFPNLSPSAGLVQSGQTAKTPAQWNAFVRAFRIEMAQPDRSRELDLLATLSHSADFAIGCYCADEARCHRSVLRELLEARGASFAGVRAPWGRRFPPTARTARKRQSATVRSPLEPDGG
jgi:uncharacterized protein YeaO (DUF488 family)